MTALILVYSIELKPITIWTSINATTTSNSVDTKIHPVIVLKNNLLTTLQLWNNEKSARGAQQHQKLNNKKKHTESPSAAQTKSEAGRVNDQSAV